ncbi:hypothetical protein LCER1_G001438, partial [Lachnellula cervina]
MGSVIYLTIEQSHSFSSSDPRYWSSMTIGPEPPNRTDAFLRRTCTPATLATCWEMLISSFCSLITTSYTLHNELRQRTNPISIPTTSSSSSPETPLLAFNPGHMPFILDPSPPLMLAACLALGCAISSFAYRRQEHDRYQAPIFILAITAATLCGLLLDVGSDVVMLGLIPWAVCVAMGAST